MICKVEMNQIFSIRLCSFLSTKSNLFLIMLSALLSLPGYALEGIEGIRVTQILNTTTAWNGEAIRYPDGQAQITGLMVEIPVGKETGWHSHPVSSFGVIVEGELEITLKDGRKKLIKAGQALAEVINTMHNGKNVGTVPVKLYVFYAGATGLALTEKP